MQSSANLSQPGFSVPIAIRTRPLSRPAHTVFHMAETEIYAQGSRAGAIYRIEFGAVRIHRLLADGRRQIVAFHVAGETFGFEAGAVRSFFAECIVATGLTSLDYAGQDHYEPELMEMALRGLVRAQEHLLVIGRQQSLEKMAVFLMDLAERQGGLDSVDLVMSRTDIGDYLGMTIETVSRSISKLRSLGILRLKSLRCIEILEIEKLRQLAS
jgi:CRP/FNR family transcriptional regulator, nitrogen fixation regulation protein